MSETQQTPHNNSNKKSRGLFNFIKIIIFFIFIISFAGSVAWGFWSNKMYQEAKSQINQLTSLDGQQELAKQEINQVLNKVRKHIQLPEDEEPVMATVVDAAALSQEQSFYKDANNGDRVIVYQKAQKAILYNPEKDIIINVGPVFLDETQQEPVEPETVSPVETTESLSNLEDEENLLEEVTSGQ